MKLEFIIEPLDKIHYRENFGCGETGLNDFLRKYAQQNAKRGLGRTFVAVLLGEKQVLGYLHAFIKKYRV